VKGGTAGDSAVLFGQALALTPGLREKITIVAKMDIIFPSAIDTTTEHLETTLNWYLSSLKTSYVDVLLLHYSNALMNATAIAEFFAAKHQQGSVRHFGVSNHYPSKLDLLQTKLDRLTGGAIKLVTTEFECSVWNPSYMNYNSPVLDHATAKGLRPLAWGALAGDPIGGLNRLFQRKGTRQTSILNALSDVGSSLGIQDQSVVALLWLLSHPSGIIPLIGTTNTSRMELQASAFNYLGKMTNDQWWAIGGKGGLCPLGDSQCNYDLYKA
jgi:predicted oxidoreductase